MDSKKVIEKLLKIASNQQKIIMKLAQEQGLAPAPTPVMAPQHLDPNKAEKQTARAVLNALTPAVRQTIVNLEDKGEEMHVGFKPGQATQANYNAILQTMQKLTDQNILPHAYKLVAV